jgi:hypothetical protein
MKHATDPRSRRLRLANNRRVRRETAAAKARGEIACCVQTPDGWVHGPLVMRLGAGALALPGGDGDTPRTVRPIPASVPPSAPAAAPGCDGRTMNDALW